MFWETIGIDSKDMAKSSRNSIQNYPRVDDFLDDSKLVNHPSKIGERELVKLIKQAIQDANNKSSRESLQLPPNATDEELNKICKREGINLFKYFKKYCGDPAATAHQVQGKHFRDVGREQFRNRSLQKERMNSGWRYQFLALSCARQSKRFNTISDLNSAEADFNAVIAFLDQKEQPLSLYVSVKNRLNTMGGQDWPKAIQALEKVAQADKNRRGAYCCVFGIAMDRGTRQIKKNSKTGQPHSNNTEIWLSDYFWPFFANRTYQEMMEHVLQVLLDTSQPSQLAIQIQVPEALINAFGDCCKDKKLVDEQGIFHDPFKLVQFFCE